MRTIRPYIYIVDDNKLSLKALQHSLKKSTDYNVRTFASAEECLRIIKLRTPALVIADLNLNSEAPENMNGDKFLNILRDFDSKLPVIIYSSNDSIEGVYKEIESF